MSEIRSTEERIAELDKKMEQIKAQKKAILCKFRPTGVNISFETV